MIQSTSQEAYDKIVAELGNRQYQVYKALLSIEPACNKEIAKKLDLPINEVTPRIKELRYKGVVEEAYKAEYDGHKAIHWQTINPAMRKFEKDNPIEDWHPQAVSWLNDPIEIIKRK